MYACNNQFYAIGDSKRDLIDIWNEEVKMKGGEE